MAHRSRVREVRTNVVTSSLLMRVGQDGRRGGSLDPRLRQPLAHTGRPRELWLRCVVPAERVDDLARAVPVAVGLAARARSVDLARRIAARRVLPAAALARERRAAGRADGRALALDRV